MPDPQPSPVPAEEPRRLEVLRDYRILDTSPSASYDDLVHLAARICRAPIALISLVDQHRQWLKSKVGLDVSETPREHAFCAYAILEPDEVMIVPDATRDERFKDNPLVREEPKIRFYAGCPIVAPTGEVIGTLCVLDRVERELDPEQIDCLRALARLTMAQIEQHRSLHVLEEVVLDQRSNQERLEAYQRELEEKASHLEEESRTDSLTGVYNRRAFERRLEEELERAARHELPLSLVLLDVDRFKRFNDDFGHPAGDEVLKGIAWLLRQNARTNDLVARYGGDELAVVLPHTDAGGALMFAERFRRVIQRAVWPHRAVTASLGAATLSRDMQTAHDLIQLADCALYAAKKKGRNRAFHARDPEVAEA